VSKEYDNTNKGAVWGCKKTCKGHPDMKGTIDVKGKKMNVSIWLTDDFKLTKKGNVKKCKRPSARLEVQKHKPKG